MNDDKVEITVNVSRQTRDQFEALRQLRQRGKTEHVNFREIAGQKIDQLMSKSEVIISHAEIR